MKILIADDDENKRLQIDRFVRSNHPSCDVKIAKSFHSALAAIIGSPFDLILLDMTMPTYDIGGEEDGGRLQHYAGRELLRQLDRRAIKSKVIIVTQYDVFGQGRDTLTRDQLDLALKEEHPDSYLETVYYNVALDDWMKRLNSAIARIACNRQ